MRRERSRVEDSRREERILLTLRVNCLESRRCREVLGSLRALVKVSPLSLT